LIGRANSADVATGIVGEIMDAKTRFILATVMSSMMVFMVTLTVTYLNLGLGPDFLAQRVTGRIVRLIGG
jgi:uncharacterized membrane protein